MNQDRSVEIFGKVEGVISVGDYATVTQNLTKHDISDEIIDMMKSLAIKYPDATNTEKQIVVRMEIQQRLKSDSTFKDRFMGAATSGGAELVKAFTDNPFINVPLEMVKGWIDS